MSTVVQVASPAKINQFLHVVGKRENGYHELETLFQFLDFADTLTFEIHSSCNNQIKRIDHHRFALHENDLIIQAASHLQKMTNRALPDISITLDKKIPPGSGLGGGSSNAATTLLTLNNIWQLGLNQQQLLNIAVKLGADVPVFISGHSCLATGIGDNLLPTNTPESNIVLCLPPVHAATASVFQALKPPFRQPSNDNNVLLKSRDNDLESIACRLYPQIGKALSILREIGDARMSGTGAAVFAHCNNSQSALQIASELQNRYPDCSWIAAQTMNTSMCQFAN